MPGFWRYFGILFGGLVLTIVALSYMFYREEVKIERQRIIERDQHHVEIQHDMLVRALKQATDALAHIGDLAALHRPFSDPGGLRLLEAGTASFLHRASSDNGVRLLDTHGRELMRAGRLPAAVPGLPDLLHTTAQLEVGGVYLSPIQLERTHTGPVPVVWLTLALFEGDRRVGALMLRQGMADLFRRFRQVMDTDDSEAYLIDQAGFFLSSPHPEWNWGFVLPERRNWHFGAVYPAAWQQILRGHGGVFETGGDVYMYSAVDLVHDLHPRLSPEAARGFHWFIVSRFPAASLSRMMGQERALFLAGSGILILAAALIARMLARLHVQRLQARRQLVDSRRELAHIMATTPAVHYVLHVHGVDFTPAFISSNLSKLFGWQYSDVVGNARWWISHLHPEERRQTVRGLRRALAGDERVYMHEYRFRCTDGRYLWIHDCLTIERNAEGQAVEIVGSWLDISDRVKAEDRLRASLREKEVLLRELHHRVKNNMQIVSSLLRLQATQAHDTRLQAMCRDSQERIRTMSLVHEQLYASERLDTIPAQAYIENIVATLVKSRGISRQRITVRVDADDIVMGMDEAVPCGLIINELVSNALKHAFPEGRGSIHVSLSAPDDAHRLIRVYDDGCGLPQGMDVHAAKTLGLQLVDALAAQLGGELSIINAHGTDIRILFPAARGGNA